ncbi:hypothetical protein EG328_002831 [Venturia inaequalis]|nr:hypothetical protein EG328_002831 [Venturia inaequalis]
MVKDRLDGNKLYTEEAKENIQLIEVTSMPHPSAMDPELHCTIEATGKDGKKKKQHVTVDADKQQPAM